MQNIRQLVSATCAQAAPEECERVIAALEDLERDFRPIAERLPVDQPMALLFSVELK